MRDVVVAAARGLAEARRVGCETPRGRQLLDEVAEDLAYLASLPLHDGAPPGPSGPHDTKLAHYARGYQAGNVAGHQQARVRYLLPMARKSH